MYVEFENIMRDYLCSDNPYKVEVGVSNHRGDQQQCYAIITTEYCLAMIVVWESGEWESEVINIQTGERIHWEYYELESISQMRTRFTTIIDLIEHYRKLSS